MLSLTVGTQHTLRTRRKCGVLIYPASETGGSLQFSQEFATGGRRNQSKFRYVLLEHRFVILSNPFTRQQNSKYLILVHLLPNCMLC
jgi:hypothetical protein